VYYFTNYIIYRILKHGGGEIKAHEIINHFDSFSDNDTIYVKPPWKLDSDAISATEPDEWGMPSASFCTAIGSWLCCHRNSDSIILARKEHLTIKQRLSE